MVTTWLLTEKRESHVRQQLHYCHAIMGFKCMTGCALDFSFSKYIQRATITKFTMRNSQMLNINIPLYKTATGQRTLHLIRTVKLWKSLASTLKSKPTLKDFKVCLKRSLTSNLFRDLIAFVILI